MTKPGRLLVTRESPKRSYHLAGRGRIEGGELVVYLDDIGRFTMDPIRVRVVLLLGGTVPITGPDGVDIIGERREGGRGLWIPVGEEWYSIPVRSLIPVLEGKAKKAPVFRWEKETDNG
ncbi:MAG: hypothetical protein V1862_05440 [Methanobacteriota archaeon]